jgi:hypothetical protein
MMAATRSDITAILSSGRGGVERQVLIVNRHHPVHR